jgi:hypothetical protein
MSEIAASCLLIVLLILTICAMVACVWVEVDEASREKRKWRHGRPSWMRIIKR